MVFFHTSPGVPFSGHHGELLFVSSQALMLLQVVHQTRAMGSSPTASVMCKMGLIHRDQAPGPHFFPCPGLLALSCCITNDHKLGGFKQHPFVSSEFCRSEVWSNIAGFPAWVSQAKIKMAAGSVLIWRLGYSSKLMPAGRRARSPHSLAGCWTKGCSQFLKATQAPPHMASHLQTSSGTSAPPYL